MVLGTVLSLDGITNTGLFYMVVFGGENMVEILEIIFGDKKALPVAKFCGCMGIYFISLWDSRRRKNTKNERYWEDRPMNRAYGHHRYYTNS